MSRPASSVAATRRSCPHCLHPNAATAAFCAACGTAMVAAAPPAALQASWWRRSSDRILPIASGALGTAEGLITAEPGPTHAAVRAVLSGWSSQGIAALPSGSGQRIAFYRDFQSPWLTLGLRVRYQGEVSLASQAIGRTKVRVQHAVDWGSATGFLLVLLACCLYIAARNGGGGLELLFILGIAGWYAWTLAAQQPEAWGRELLAALPARIAASAGGATLRDNSMLEMFKVLQELRTQGMLSAEDFEHMKAELRKQL